MRGGRLLEEICGNNGDDGGRSRGSRVVRCQAGCEAVDLLSRFCVVGDRFRSKSKSILSLGGDRTAGWRGAVYDAVIPWGHRYPLP